MAKRIITQYYDDIDGSELGPDEVTRVALVVRGVEYELELSEQNSERLDEQLKPWLDAGRRVGGRRKAAATVDKEQTKAVRAWANANGFKVANIGRIPAHVFEAYNKAH